LKILYEKKFSGVFSNLAFYLPWPLLLGKGTGPPPYQGGGAREVKTSDEVYTKKNAIALVLTSFLTSIIIFGEIHEIL